MNVYRLIKVSAVRGGGLIVEKRVVVGCVSSKHQVSADDAIGAG
jgi:hypothetical protein